MNLWSFSQYIDNELIEIKKIFDSIVSIQNEQKIVVFEKQIDSLLNIYLAESNNFENDLSFLKDYCVTIFSSDKKLKILTWYAYYPISYSYNYHGYIMYKQKKNMFNYFKLIDKSDEIQNCEFQILNENNWYGCVYYEIIEKKRNSETLYTLLGWDGNSFLSNKKIIEVLEIKIGRASCRERV